MKSRVQRKIERNFRLVIINLLLRPPLSVLVKTEFKLSATTRYLDKKTSHTREFYFSSKRLTYEESEFDLVTKEGSQVKKIERSNQAKEFKHFINLLLQAGFINARADTGYSNYSGSHMPKTESCSREELILSWLWSDKTLFSVEQLDDSNYGLSEEDREKFGVFEEYINSLANGTSS